MMGRVSMLFGVLVVHSICIQGWADIAVVAGYTGYFASINPPYGILAESFTIGEIEASPISIPVLPNGQALFFCVGIDSFTGATVFGGVNYLTGRPIIYRGSVVSSEVTSITIPGTGQIDINAVAMSPDGSAIFGCENITDSEPLIYRLPRGALEVTLISIPENDGGAINAVAIGPDGTATLAGITGAGLPLIYRLFPGATEATRIRLPVGWTDTGSINSVAVGSNGTAILGGQDVTSSSALVWTLSSGSLSPTIVETPNPGDFGLIKSVAIAPNGTAILCGGIGDIIRYPLIYRLLQGASLVSIIANANENLGQFIAVAIGSDGVAILGGASETNDQALICRIGPEDNQAAAIYLPAPDDVAIYSIAIGAGNIAVLGGIFYGEGDSLPAAYTLSATSFVVSPVIVPISAPHGEIVNVAVYSCDGLYDIRRIRPYYYLQQDEATNLLN